MAVKDAGSKDWSRAEQYYYQAVDVFPEGICSDSAGVLLTVTINRRKLTAGPELCQRFILHHRSSTLWHADVNL